MSSSPIRKRQRFSSPSYDQHLFDLSQEDIAAIEEIEAKHCPGPLGGSHEAAEKRISGIENALLEESHARTTGDHLSSPNSDRDDPFCSMSLAFCPTSSPSSFTSAFALASTLPAASQTRSRSSSPELPPERDYSSWFTPGLDTVPNATISTPLPLFQTAKSTMAAIPNTPQFTKTPQSGFIAASENALKVAQEKMKAWETEEGGPASSSSRPVLQSVRNYPSALVKEGSQPPSTPTPLLFSRASASIDNDFKEPQRKPKPFKSPFLSSSIERAHPPSKSQDSKVLSFASASEMLASTPARQRCDTPKRSAGISGRRMAGKHKFVTPFKSGMGPGELGRIQLEQERNGEDKIKSNSELPRSEVDGETKEAPGKGQGDALGKSTL